MRSIVLLSLFFGFFAHQTLWAQKREVVVVIDPGHGGQDPGHLAVGNVGLPEKDLNLKIALYLGGYIEKYLQNVKVVYTRTTDVYPSLDDRVNKANSMGADYFISVHCNGNDRSNVHGTESHVHSMSLSKSVAFAKEIEYQFSNRAGRKSRGVKDERDLQHSLQVLKFTNMTSVLVECGFLTHSGDRDFLNTTYGQEIIASAIFRAFRTTIVKEHPQISFIRSQPAAQPVAQVVSASKGYAIQIASSREAMDTNDSWFKKVGMPVERKELNTSSAYKYIYLAGDYATKQEAKDALAEIQAKGYKDAIVVKRP
jgi:N-acetylmuramoyl-L-alanine amidase